MNTPYVNKAMIDGMKAVGHIIEAETEQEMCEAAIELVGPFMALRAAIVQRIEEGL